jgi:hypothetical protein
MAHWVADGVAHRRTVPIIGCTQGGREVRDQCDAAADGECGDDDRRREAVSP